MDKPVLREAMLRKMRTQASRKKSGAIRKKLLSLQDYSDAKVIFSYISRKGEADTHDIIRHSLRKGKMVFAPVTASGGMVACEIKNFSQLKPGKYGILEPPFSRGRKRFDMIIVPGIAFDTRGARIGRGGGHFDRFLSGAKGRRIGLAFDFQVLDKIDTESHDIFVDKILTEKRAIDARTEFLTVAIPACNEQDNIKRIEKELMPVLEKLMKYEILIVDDGSTDSTAQEVRKLQRRYKSVRLVSHGRNLGLGCATRTAIRHACGNIMIFLDADFTFHPREIPKLLERYRKGDVDCVAGSQFGEGGNTLPAKRLVLSKGVNVLYQLLLGKKLTSTSSIFRLYKTDQLRQLRLSGEQFSICAEILFKLMLDKRRVEEVPVLLTTRIYGESKIRNARETKNHLTLLSRIALWRFRHFLGAKYA